MSLSLGLGANSPNSMTAVLSHWFFDLSALGSESENPLASLYHQVEEME